MTNPLKEYETPEFFKRRSMHSFWRMRHDSDRLRLEESLIWDGRFYGAEWVEYSHFEELVGILAPYITKPIDPVKIVREIRDE